MMLRVSVSGACGGVAAMARRVFGAGSAFRLGQRCAGGSISVSREFFLGAGMLILAGGLARGLSFYGGWKLAQSFLIL